MINMTALIFIFFISIVRAAVNTRTITSSGFSRSYAYTNGENNGNAIISMSGGSGPGNWCNTKWAAQLSNSNFMLVCLSGMQWDDNCNEVFDGTRTWLSQFKADGVLPDCRVPSGQDRDTDLIYVKDVIQDIKTAASISTVYINGYSSGADMALSLYFTSDLPNSGDDSFQEYIDTEVSGVTISGFAAVSKGLRTGYNNTVPNDVVPVLYQYGTSDTTDGALTGIMWFADTKACLENAQGCDTQTNTHDTSICSGSYTKETLEYSAQNCDANFVVHRLDGVSHDWTRCQNYKTENKIVFFHGLD